MKHLFSTIAFILASTIAKAQIHPLRYEDDFSHLLADSVKKTGLQKLKYIPLRKKLKASFGGEVREQLQYYNNINFGDVPPSYKSTSTFQLWHRAMIHANIDAGGNNRVFLQLGSTFRLLNPNPAVSEIDENHLSLHQLFGDLKLSKNWMMRIGRQEMSYGSHRLITFREGPNTRLTFDALVVKHSKKNSSLDILLLSPVVSRKGIFDDGTFKDMIVGFYGRDKIERIKLGVDYYFLNFESRRRKYNYEDGHEQRKIIGFRAFSKNKVANYEAEAIYQFGKFSDSRINAYAFFTDVHAALFQSRLVLGIAGNYVSGDRNKDDNELNTFNSLFSKPQYGLTAPIGTTNIATLNPYIRINRLPKNTMFIGAYFMWRQSSQDGSYGPDGTQIRPRPEKLFAITERALGTLLVVETSHSINDHWVLACDGSHFIAGKFMDRTGKGKNITYLSFKASYKF